MNSVGRFLLALGWLLVLFACASAPEPFEFDGTRWLLASIGGQQLQEHTVITMKFTNGGISGSAGCNRYGARYLTQPRNQIYIGELSNTDMGCPGPAGVMEKAYLSMLREVTSYMVDGDRLVLKDQPGTVLLEYRLLPKFEANPSELVGKSWQLKSADGIGDTVLDQFILEFVDNITYRGTTSCRDFEGTYETEGDTILITTMKMLSYESCPQSVGHDEGIYTNLLSKVEQYHLVDNRLELYTIQNEKLVFEQKDE